MTIKKGDKIKVDYEGKLGDGTIFDTSKHGDHSHPLEFTVGEGKIIKGFDEAVIGMAVGEEKEITLKPEKAYGEKKEDLFKKFQRDKLPKDKEPKPGMVIMLGTPDGKKFPARITEVTEKDVTIDLNHPLSGKTLTFNIKITEVN